jgi:hypothetical protein
MSNLRPVCVRAIALGLAASAVMSIGCAAPKPPPTIAPDGWTGPAVTLGARDGNHLIQIEAPTPGWVPSLDQTRQAWRSQEVYVTLREPSPLYFYPQVMTKHDVGTAVSTATALRVYVRRVPADAKANDETAYQLAARSGE